MWRNKVVDSRLSQKFYDMLVKFKTLKENRWEQMQDLVQMDNRLANHTEDLLPLPDEEKLRYNLSQDPDYLILKKEIEDTLPEVKELAKFLNFNSHHKLDWIQFTEPLIGTSALEDGIECAKELNEFTRNSSYILKNLSHTLR
jgi:hypothetical protein